MPTGVLAADNWMPIYYVSYYNGWPLSGNLAVDAFWGGGDGGVGLFCLLSVCQANSDSLTPVGMSNSLDEKGWPKKASTARWPKDATRCNNLKNKKASNFDRGCQSLCLSFAACMYVCLHVCLSVCLYASSSLKRSQITVFTIPASVLKPKMSQITVFTMPASVFSPKHVCLSVCLSLSACMSLCLSVCLSLWWWWWWSLSSAVCMTAQV